MSLRYELRARDGRARLGRLHFARGVVDTPAFMPVGTYGAVRGLAPSELCDCGVQMLLCNALHLMLRPGAEHIAALGGLHRFMAWPRLLLSDSGGYQLFSLRDRCRIGEEGAVLRSPLDGSELMLSPERAIEVQQALGVDVLMVLDECTHQPGDRAAAQAAMERSLRWAARCREAHGSAPGALFGIVQGGIFPQLRSRSLAGLGDDFSGYAIGGLAVGEDFEQRLAVLDTLCGQLPSDRPRYLMGLGKPLDLLEAVRRGVDMFDCVLPTRNARNGQLFTSRGTLNLRNAVHRDQLQAPDPDCRCYTCRHFSRAYLHHLTRSRELLGARLNSLHNVYYYQQLMHRLRCAIAAGTLERCIASCIAGWQRGEKACTS